MAFFCFTVKDRDVKKTKKIQVQLTCQSGPCRHNGLTFVLCFLNITPPGQQASRMKIRDTYLFLIRRYNLCNYEDHF